MNVQNFAIANHEGQMYGDEPYTTHLAAVASHFIGLDFEVLPEYIIEYRVAWLHDILEDTMCTPKVLEDFAGTEVMVAVQLITKDPKLTYFENIQRIIDSGNITAMRVKHADNWSNYCALGKPQNKEKYLKSMHMLSEAMDEYHNGGI